MIIVTGGLGFIGSALIEKWNDVCDDEIIIVDKEITKDKLKNVEHLNFNEILKPNELFGFIKENHNRIQFIYHLGAISDTTCTDFHLLNKYNYDYTIDLFALCNEFDLKIMYASSAATYGDGSEGYDDKTEPDDLSPLNLYGKSKNDIDHFIIDEHTKIQPKKWWGFKFFNVYGSPEHHKGHMASVVYHATNQLKKDGVIHLFKSDRSDYADGEQLRDFIYVKDVVDVLFWLYLNKNTPNGIYNLGTGKARTFNDLAKAIIKTAGYGVIEYIDMPEKLIGRYQYYTEAKMNKLRNAGYKKSFTDIEDGCKSYVKEILNEK